MNKKRTLKEAEELIHVLQTKCFSQYATLKKMRMALYYAKKSMQTVDEEIDGMWLHHQDGSDLLVSKEELFNVMQNKIRNEIRTAIRKINVPLAELIKFIGW